MEKNTPKTPALAVTEHRGRLSLIDKAAVAVGAVVLSVPAFADFDVTDAESALTGLIAAFGALGVLKVGPAITMWAWSKVTAMAGRG